MRWTLILIALTAAPLFSQTGEVARIEWSGNRGTLIAVGGRPVHAAAAELAKRFGMAVSVEDPAYVFDGDTVDVTEQVARAAVDHRILVPRGSRLEVPFEAKDDGSPVNRIAFLESVVELANIALPFGFRLESSSQPFAIVPTKTRDERGEETAFTPLLDRVISIPRARRPIHLSGDLLAKALSEQTGLTISCCQSVIGGVPWGLQEAEFGADAEPARDVLRRLLKLTPGRYIWLLNCDPSPSPWCFINLQAVTTTTRFTL